MPNQLDITAKYAEREIKLAKALIEADNNDQNQRDRLAFWLAWQGNFEEADQIKVSKNVKLKIEELRNAERGNN